MSVDSVGHGWAPAIAGWSLIRGFFAEELNAC